MLNISMLKVLDKNSAEPLGQAQITFNSKSILIVYEFFITNIANLS